MRIETCRGNFKGLLHRTSISKAAVEGLQFTITLGWSTMTLTAFAQNQHFQGG